MQLRNVGQIALVDDSAQKIVDAAKELYDENPNLRPLLGKFTLIVFDPELKIGIKGTIHPGIAHVKYMQSWRDNWKVLHELRTVSQSK